MLRFREYLKEFKVSMPDAKNTLGIKRGHMPQVDSKDHDELIKFLNDKGIKITKRKVAAKTLKATQANFNKDKVVGAAANYHTLHKAKPILVSKDNYIIDGHHRWLGALNVGGDINIIQANVNVQELLKAVREFPKTYTKNINEENS